MGKYAVFVSFRGYWEEYPPCRYGNLAFAIIKMDKLSGFLEIMIE